MKKGKHRRSLDIKVLCPGVNEDCINKWDLDNPHFPFSRSQKRTESSGSHVVVFMV